MMFGACLLGESVGAGLLTVGIYETIRLPSSEWTVAIVFGAIIVVLFLLIGYLVEDD